MDQPLIFLWLRVSDLARRYWRTTYFTNANSKWDVNAKSKPVLLWQRIFWGFGGKLRFFLCVLFSQTTPTTRSQQISKESQEETSCIFPTSSASSTTKKFILFLEWWFLAIMNHTYSCERFMKMANYFIILFRSFS